MRLTVPGAHIAYGMSSHLHLHMPPAKRVAVCPPVSESCELHQALRSSVIKRVRYPHVLPQCEGTRGSSAPSTHTSPPAARCPTGCCPMARPVTTRIGRLANRKVLVIEDSQVFATLTASTLRTHFSGSTVDIKTSFAAAESDLNSIQYTAVICGYGLGGDHTVHDVRRVTKVPIVVLTGRPDEIALPSGSRKVMKASGPDALASAVREMTS